MPPSLIPSQPHMSLILSSLDHWGSVPPDNSSQLLLLTSPGLAGLLAPHWMIWSLPSRPPSQNNAGLSGVQSGNGEVLTPPPPPPSSTTTTTIIINPSTSAIEDEAMGPEDPSDGLMLYKSQQEVVYHVSAGPDLDRIWQVENLVIINDLQCYLPDNLAKKKL